VWKICVSVHDLGKSVDFLQTMHSLLVISEDIVINFDVASLFTKAPIQYPLTLQRRQFDEDNVTLSHCHAAVTLVRPQQSAQSRRENCYQMQTTQLYGYASLNDGDTF